MAARMSGIVAAKLLDDVQRVALACPVILNALQYQRAAQLSGAGQDFLMAEPMGGDNVWVQLLCDLLACFGDKAEPVINSRLAGDIKHIAAQKAGQLEDRKSTRLNSSHVRISY